jgi:hypothetical protein
MRALVCAILLSVSLLGGVGDSNGLDEVFPDAATTARNRPRLTLHDFAAREWSATSRRTPWQAPCGARVDLDDLARTAPAVEKQSNEVQTI